jgi:CBS domain-containing protein
VAPHPLLFILFREFSPRSDEAPTVGDAMTQQVITIGAEESIWEAAFKIDRHGVRRLPVVDEQGFLAGVITRSDLVRAMARGRELRAAAS